MGNSGTVGSFSFGGHAEVKCEPNQYPRTGDYITTISGEHVYPLTNPQPEQFKLYDVAHGLSRICRFNGHVERHYSVGLHTLGVVEVIAHLGGNALDQLWGLHHDDAEAYMCDVPKPIKPFIVGYEEQEARLTEVIHEAFKIPCPTNVQYRIVKHADVIMLHNEAKKLTLHHDWADERFLLDFVTFPEYTMNEVREMWLEKHYELMLECIYKRLL